MVTFAVFSLYIELLQDGQVEDARRLLLYLLYNRVLLPESCRGALFDGGCEPVLPVGWFVGAQQSLSFANEILVERELRNALPLERQRAAGRSIAVVTAHHAPRGKGIWRLKNRQGSSRESDDELGTLTNWSARNTARLMPWYLENKRCYAWRHGYNFVFERRAPRLDLQVEHDGYAYGIHWIKLSAVRKALRSYDWVFWVDYDTLFANISQTLDEIIDVVERHSGSIDLVVQNGWDLVNPNAFLLRSSLWSFRFLDMWESFGRQLVRGRSKMWELRCFNCAIVQTIIFTTVGRGLRACGEYESHVLLLRHLLEKHGFNYHARQRLVTIGRIYFWDPSTHVPRGFLFHVNEGEQQVFFNEVELYHPGDLAIHWPKPNKDTPLMRNFANELPEARGCARWAMPHMDLPGAYDPVGVDSDAPSLYGPEHVIRIASRMIEIGSSAMRAVGPEGLRMLGPLVDALSSTTLDVVDVLLGRDALPHELAELEAYPAGGAVRLRTGSSMSELPLQKLYDFIYLGIRAVPAAGSSSQAEVDAEVHQAIHRLRPGGLAAMPLHGCDAPTPGPSAALSGLEPSYATYMPPVHWRWTRTAGSTGIGCRWAYYHKPVASNDNYKIWQRNRGSGASRTLGLVTL